MMSLSACKVAWALFTVVASGPLTASEQRVRHQIAPSLLFLEENGKKIGVATLIDSKGLFLTHVNSAPDGTFLGVFESGGTLRLKRIATDRPSQLALLQSLDRLPEEAEVISVEPKICSADESLVMVSIQGTSSASSLPNRRLGILASSRQMIPLTEVKLESDKSNELGALVFTMRGTLYGVMNAYVSQKTLAKSSLQDNMGLRNTAAPLASSKTALTLSPSLLQRVVSGFRSENHKVIRPFLGASAKDAKGGGALVEKIANASPAADAGLKKGDVIKELGGYTVHNHIDFANALLTREPGETFDISIERAGRWIVLTVTLAERD